MNINKVEDILSALEKLSGGYVYSGICSYQVCFPLRAGGELRFSLTDDKEGLQIDIYGGELPPGISGPSWKTGKKKK